MSFIDEIKSSYNPRIKAIVPPEIPGIALAIPIQKPFIISLKKSADWKLEFLGLIICLPVVCSQAIQLYLQNIETEYCFFSIFAYLLG